MSTTTALILIGHGDPFHGGISPKHLIRFTENSRPALFLQPIEATVGWERAQEVEGPKVIIPTLENTIDDIYLMIAVFVLKKLHPKQELHSLQRKSLYEIFDEKERIELYKKTKEIMRKTNIKVVFNILKNSLLLNQIDLIKKYPNDYEITLPFIKDEKNSIFGKVTFENLSK